MTSQRTTRFQRNAGLEDLLAQLNTLLVDGESSVAHEFQEPELPVVLVVGPPRSGTTLMMQWLSETGLFAVPTNLLSRFFRAPYVGALICRLIADPRFNYGNELADHSSSEKPFRSELGKTRGMFQPNEFWYFWRRFIPNDQGEWLSEERLKQIDGKGFLAGLAALQVAFERPWAMKGIILQYNLRFLDQLIKNVIFIHTQRDLEANARSLLQARTQYFGSEDQWFSVKPPGYESLLNLGAAQQVVGQVALTNRSIRDELASIADERRLSVNYEDFCRDPKRVFDQLKDKLVLQGMTVDDDYQGQQAFEAQLRRGNDENDIVRRAVRDWRDRHGE